MNPEVETNIVFIDPTASGRKPKDIVAGLAEHGVRMGTSYGGMIRAVTHLDVTPADMEIAGAGLQGRGERRARFGQAQSGGACFNYDMPSHMCQCKVGMRLDG